MEGTAPSLFDLFTTPSSTAVEFLLKPGEMLHAIRDGVSQVSLINEKRLRRYRRLPYVNGGVK